MPVGMGLFLVSRWRVGRNIASQRVTFAASTPQEQIQQDSKYNQENQYYVNSGDLRVANKIETGNSSPTEKAIPAP